MAYRRSSDEIFIEGTIKTVAEIGIENMRTKHAAEYAGFTEATMYRRFPSKEILLRDSFLSVDRKISGILTQSAFILNPGKISFELGFYAVWRKVYRYMIDHKDETVFLIRYRYSSLYTEEVRSMRQAYSGGFSKVYELLENQFGLESHEYSILLVQYILEMTLCFAEKIIGGMVQDNTETEYVVWTAVNSAAKSFSRKLTQQGNTEQEMYGQ